MKQMRTKKSKVLDVQAPLSPVTRLDCTQDHSLEQSIGHEVRRHRKSAGLNVAALAAAADISPGMLSKIENGQISPSLATLQMLAAALNIPIALLFAAYSQHSDCSYVKAGDGAIVHRRGTGSGHKYQLLSHTLEGGIIVEPYLITLGKDASPCMNCQHDGIEFLYMLTGELMYAHDKRKFHLKPGDTLLFDSTAIHGPEKLIKTPASYLAITCHPRS